MGIVVTGGLTALPDALSSQCGGASHGGGGGGGPEAGVALLLRWRRWLVVHVDTRVANQLPIGCAGFGVPVDTAFAADLRRDPFGTSTLRIGVETPPGLPLFRLTTGAGVAWGSRPLPLGVLAVAWSTRGPHARFLIEAERAPARVRAREVHHDWANHQPDVSRPILFYPAARTVRIGVEWPLGSPR